VFLISAACAWGSTSTPALALNVIKPICSVAGLVSGIAGKACSGVQHPGRFLDAGKKLLGGHVGSAFKTALGQGGGAVASKAKAGLALAAIGAWVVGGAKFVLHETAGVLGQTTAPQLGNTWFSSAYWRVAGIAAVLTLPFLFAAAIQALVRSDLTLLVRAALGYLPLAMLAVGIAAPLTMLLLAASDQLSGIVSSAAGNQSGHFFGRASGLVGSLTALSHSPFLAFFVALLTVAGAVALWFELLMRAAAVYVIVLMLPLAFAAFVWPARRVWAIRAVELLVALILSKFVIVAVLSLGGAALSQSAMHSFTGMLAGFVLLVLGAFAPWALLRLLPLAEIASGAAGSLQREARGALGAGQRSEAWAGEGDRWASRTAEMRREAENEDATVRGDAARSQVERMDAPNEHSGAPATQADHQVRVPPASELPDPAAEATQPSAPSPAPTSSTTSSPPSPAAGSATSAAPSPDRSSTAEPIAAGAPGWRPEDIAGKVLTLGPEHPSPRFMPPDGAPEPQAPDAPRTAEHPDPSPPPQAPEDGHL
jgi:hypothetical protein